ncbi:tRNA (guanosine(46)-N7)-methyltransferase TrmB [Pseudaminobacter sp. 19-2017]|uniref:tRNA (guanine-N(7)-)-methyltransferase n=1 Tax=Pseudaminobacter soli (ex Zhang et al. 2022) TaxID=2831468 RepID=A0A942E4P9_9HYPH|nr:tRNA (guanosine(46)-N(7))-methyltransferase TrmB [Pseudaminobacter soli]MBS3651113.1 tRNA (guanosine(46)-N7)-methyltransferase TrmB [Pseudaminobacter soli]
MTDDGRPSRATEGFFGRRRGKPVRAGQAEALAAGLQRCGLDLTTPAPADLRELFPVPVSQVRLEIGFGGGEHLFHTLTEEPEVGFIGVEPFVNGMAKLMARVQAEPRPNLRVFDDDAIRLLDWLPAGSLDRIVLLYPDPWPKKRHWKRRFVSQTNLDRMARALRSGGEFRFASDINTYVNWTLLHCRAHGAFKWTAREAADWDLPFEGWPGTRYEAKALREGRRPAYLTFRRR